MSKRSVGLMLLLILGLGALLSACASPTPQIIEKTVEVEKIVEKEVEVEKEVVVTKEVEKVVEVTPPPVEYWDPDEVTAATGPEACVPLATLPKEFSEEWRLGFVHVLKSHPFHGTVAKGIEAAAAFYGVELIEGDTAGSGGTAVIEMASTVLLDEPHVVGLIGQGPDVRDPVAGHL